MAITLKDIYIFKYCIVIVFLVHLREHESRTITEVTRLVNPVFLVLLSHLFGKCKRYI